MAVHRTGYRGRRRTVLTPHIFQSEMTDRTIYVATTSHGWGLGMSQYKAVRAITPHERPDPDDTVHLAVFKVKGFEDIWPFEIVADEVMSESYFKVSGEKWNEMRSSYLEMEAATDDMMADAEEVERGDL